MDVASARMPNAVNAEGPRPGGRVVERGSGVLVMSGSGKVRASHPN